MIVLKFGGTSVGSVENMNRVAQIVLETKAPKIVVLSAMSGVTNTLQKICDYLKLKKLKEASDLIDELNFKYENVVLNLLISEIYLNKGKRLIMAQNRELRSFLNLEYTSQIEKIILSKGEIISTVLFQLLLEQKNAKSILISALDFMKIDDFGGPKINLIKEKLTGIIKANYSNEVYVTQGFICKNGNNEIGNLERGGSDYSASLIGAAVGASEIQIWTDINGMHNNDPRYVDHTTSIEEISFEEAAELAYFGAKILHPQSIIPAKEKNIPVLIKNTFRPKDRGTLIHTHAKPKKIRAIAAKDNITAIKIKSYRMLMAYGFLKKIFEVFEQNETAIDMITTSEVAVSLTIDNIENLENIVNELKGFGNIELDSELSIICIAGNLAQNKKGITSKIFNSLKEIPIRMISYGGSNYNLSFLVKTSDKIAVLNLLNKDLFKRFRVKKEAILI